MSPVCGSPPLTETVPASWRGDTRGPSGQERSHPGSSSIASIVRRRSPVAAELSRPSADWSASPGQGTRRTRNICAATGAAYPRGIPRVAAVGPRDGSSRCEPPGQSWNGLPVAPHARRAAAPGLKRSPKRPSRRRIRSSTRFAPLGVGPAERTAAEGREAQAEDRADVAVARAAQDPFTQREDGLVDHLQHAALDDLLAVDLLALPPARAARRRRSRPRPSSSSDRRRCRSPCRSCGRAAPTRPPSPMASGTDMRSPKAPCSTLATLAPTSMPTSSSSVIGPDREAEVDQRAVDVLHRRALQEQHHRLVHVRRRARGSCRSPARRRPR